MVIRIEDTDIETVWRRGTATASTSPDDMGQDDPATDAPGQDSRPGAIDDPVTDAPGQDSRPGAVDDAPPTDAPGQDGTSDSVDDPTTDPPSGPDSTPDAG